MRILIAEDDFIGRKVLQTYLNKFGTCDIAVNGMEAVNMFLRAHKEQKPYDLVCLDIMMPIMDGIEVLKTIRNIEKQKKQTKISALSPNSQLPNSGSKSDPSDLQVCDPLSVKIIITSALNDRKTVTESFSTGCEAYVWKPIDVEQFHETLVKLGLINIA